MTRGKTPLIAIALISAGAIAYEVLLMRLFAIVQWHHFAFMIISLALLGYGASGTFLALARDRLLARFAIAWPALALGFGLTALGSFALAQRVPFNALAFLWDPKQLAYLGAIYFFLMVPFFCAASCIALAFTAFGRSIPGLYRADLIGAGIGATLIVCLLFILFPDGALRAMPLLGGFAAAAFVLATDTRSARRSALGWALAGMVLAFAVPASWTQPALSPYKDLSGALRLPDAARVFSGPNPVGVVDVVQSPTIPFRHAPGLSLNARAPVPEQFGVFVDGGKLQALTRNDRGRDALAFLDDTTDALPYHLRDRPEVMILGLGTGANALLALYHGASTIEAAETHPLLARGIAGPYRSFGGDLPGLVDIAVATPRQHVRGTARRFDLIQLPPPQDGPLQIAYTHTVEAVRAYLARLKPGGLLVMPTNVKVPPRDTLKLFATAIAALRQDGVTDPETRLVLIRSWQTATLLVKAGAFTNAETASVRAFARARSFDLAYLPDLTADEVNRYNLLAEPYLYQGTQALLGPEAAAYMADYKFDLRPATDDRPYFADSLKWRSLPELIGLKGQGTAALVGWGYPVLIATLLQAVVLSVLLILLPLATRPGGAVGRGGRLPTLTYFAALGLAFLLLEIAFIQKMILFLGHPLYAVAVVLAAFLVLAGIGAGLAPRLTARWPSVRRAIGVAVAAIVIIGAAYSLGLSWLLGQLIWLPQAVKIAAALLLIAPLAIVMGLPFPLALSSIATHRPALLPWAWGINGCASVIGAVLATLLAIEFGFTAVVTAALALYVLAAAVFRVPAIDHSGQPA